jgi:alpha-amylase
MSWSATGAGFSSGTPFRALSANIVTNNVAAQVNDAGSLLNHYKTLIALRRSLPSLARGSYEAASASGALLSFRRVLGNERSVVLINYGTTPATATLQGLPANALLSGQYPAGSADLALDANGSASLVVPAQSLRVFVLGS